MAHDYAEIQEFLSGGEGMNATFTKFGIIAAGVGVWIFSQQAQGEAREVFNMVLVTLLASMLILNWSEFSPLIFKNG